MQNAINAHHCHNQFVSNSCLSKIFMELAILRSFYQTTKHVLELKIELKEQFRKKFLEY